MVKSLRPTPTGRGSDEADVESGLKNRCLKPMLLKAASQNSSILLKVLKVVLLTPTPDLQGIRVGSVNPQFHKPS